MSKARRTPSASTGLIREPLRILELIAPSGIEELFRRLGEPGDEYDPATLPALVEPYGCDLDFDGTMPLMERHALHF